LSALDVMLAEYQSLEAEIRQRTTNQFLILGGAIAVVAATVPLYRGISDPTKSLLPMAAPLLLFFVGWLYFEQDVFITHVATYLHQELRQRIQMQLVKGRGQDALDPVLLWEGYRSLVLFRRDRALLVGMALFRLFFVCGPASVVAALTTMRFQWRAVDDFHHTLAVALAATGCAGGVVLVGLALRVSFLYRRIAAAGTT
jgi:hypothetical protein